MARPSTLRRRLAAVLVGGLMAVGGLLGTPETRAETPLFCGYVRSHVGVTQPIWLGWYCDSRAHPNCDGFPYWYTDAWLAEFFVCSNI